MRKGFHRAESVAALDAKSTGYSRSGESQFSRSAAHGAPRIKRATYATKPTDELRRLIASTEREIRELEFDFDNTPHADMRQKINRELAVKCSLLGRLRKILETRT